MIICHKFKFVFVHIPKTGGTSISNALRPLLGRRDDYEILRAPKHFTAAQIRQRYFTSDLEWSSYLSFAFMRNPWDRIYSDYCFCKRMAKEMRNERDPELQNWVKRIRQSTAGSFEQFVHAEYLMRNRGTYQEYCMDESDRDLLTFVGRFEHLQADWERVCNASGIPPRTLPEMNRAHRRTNDEPTLYRDAYSTKLRELVGRTFQDDIKRFDFRF